MCPSATGGCLHVSSFVIHSLIFHSHSFKQTPSKLSFFLLYCHQDISSPPTQRKHTRFPKSLLNDDRPGAPRSQYEGKPTTVDRSIPHFHFKSQRSNTDHDQTIDLESAATSSMHPRSLSGDHDITNTKGPSDDQGLLNPNHATITAVAKTLETPELLEHILSHLPVLDLVKANRVNKTFQQVIATAPTLQRNLFMLPVKESTEYWQVARSGRYRNYTYMVAAKPAGAASETAPMQPGTSHEQIACVTLCPHLKVMNTKGLLNNIPKSVADRMYYDEKESARLETNPAQAKIWHDFNVDVTASDPWTRMFLSNPQCKRAGISAVYVGLIGDKKDIHVGMEQTVERSDGVRLADLLNATQCKGTLTMCYPDHYEIYQESDGRVVIEVAQSNQASRECSSTPIEASVQKLSEAFEREGLKLSLIEKSVRIEVYGVAVPTEAERQEMREKSRVTAPRKPRARDH